MATKVVVSPLHTVIEAGRWEAEPLLGRLIVLVHAAFLDAGFVPLTRTSCEDGPVPREAGWTASALSLRYTVPGLFYLPVAVLRQQVYGRKIVLYVQCDGRPDASSWLVMADAFDAISLLTDALDATARALRRDTRLAALWRGFSDRLCRGALIDLCKFYGVALKPTFMSLPGDIKAAILARLKDGADLARVESTCTTLRRLVTEQDRELWKPLYDAETGHRHTAGDSPETSWKEGYVRAMQWRRWRTPTRRRSRVGWCGEVDEGLLPAYLDSIPRL